jgi:NAD(P)-dependent dehydrogenase (short-subunit alcohol dehydrogenase family)
MFRLDGKTALVTGAGSGLGEAIALCFAEQGAATRVVDRDQAGGLATVGAVRASGGTAEFAAAGVSDAEAPFDFICGTGSRKGRMLEYVDHLHEHFIDPRVVSRGRYRVPRAPGTGVTMRLESLEAHSYPSVEIWNGKRSQEP